MMTAEMKKNDNKGSVMARKSSNRWFILYLALLVVLLAAAVIATRDGGGVDLASPSTTQSQTLNAAGTNQPAATNLSDDGGINQTVPGRDQANDPEGNARARAEGRQRVENQARAENRALAENRARWEMNHGQ